MSRDEEISCTKVYVYRVIKINLNSIFFHLIGLYSGCPMWRRFGNTYYIRFYSAVWALFLSFAPRIVNRFTLLVWIGVTFGCGCRMWVHSHDSPILGEYSCSMVLRFFLRLVLRSNVDVPRVVLDWHCVQLGNSIRHCWENPVDDTLTSDQRLRQRTYHNKIDQSWQHGPTKQRPTMPIYDDNKVHPNQISEPSEITWNICRELCNLIFHRT